MRYLTTFPVRQWSGKNAPWYFVSRLANKENYADVGFGDRTLAIWQGQGYYYFSTCNAANSNPDVAVASNYPEDIEGLWTFVYFSYSRNARRAVGFAQYGPAATPVRIQSDVTHPDHSQLKFVLGGKQFAYPGFNGIFANVIYKLGAGAFVDNLEQFINVVAGTKKPFDDWNRVVSYE